MTTPLAPVALPGRAPPVVHRAEPAPRTATRVAVSTLGVIIGVAGIEHGIGEALQGNVAPDGIVFLSWPESDAFRILGGEPALTVVPNLLVTGILAIVISLAFLVWVTTFVERPHGGLVLLLLSAAMLLFGGGVAPPFLGALLALAASRINAPLRWWHAHLSVRGRHRLARLWPWVLMLDVVAWLLLIPGSVILGALTSADNPDPVAPGLVYGLILAAVAFLLGALGAALARDSLGQAEPQPAPGG
jgi:hypothetical protein